MLAGGLIASHPIQASTAKRQSRPTRTIYRKTETEARKTREIFCGWNEVCPTLTARRRPTSPYAPGRARQNA